MTLQARTFRVFVSSTFSDLKAERNSLQADVLTHLSELCEQQVCHPQSMDLSGDGSEETTGD